MPFRLLYRRYRKGNSRTPDVVRQGDVRCSVRGTSRSMGTLCPELGLKIDEKILILH